MRKRAVYDRIMLIIYVYNEGRIIMDKLLKITIAAMIAASMTVPAFAAPANDTTQTGGEPTEQVQATAAPADMKTTAKEKSFSDINTENYAWAKPYITSMATKGLISGYEDGTYRPDNDVTRLETISLFARAMGSNDPANKEVIEIAHERYDVLIKNYELAWGSDEVAYMMYKGALKKTDLDTYLKGQEKNNPMKRYEAAIIITKAMGGEAEALADLGVVLDYTDAREVPSNAMQYVAYATEKNIMTGMGDGTFSPNTAVKRSQISVMLSKTVDATNYTFKKVKVQSVDTDTMKITVTENSDDKTYAYNDTTSFKIKGEDSMPRTMATGVDAVATLKGDSLVALEAVSDLPDRVVTGQYVNYATTSGKTNVRIIVDETGETESFECSSDLSVTYDGSPATVRSFTKGDMVSLKIVNGKIAEMTGNDKTTKISGAVIENMDITDGVKITISHSNSEYDGKTYKVSNNVLVKKNDATVDLDKIYQGDKVNLELQYDEIVKVTATSSKKTVEGTIQKLTIASPQSTMTVRVGGEDKDYVIPSSVSITINGNEGSLYDFRVGDLVKITTESDAITKIVATSTQESSGSVTGVVSAVNTSYGVISVIPDGSSNATQIFCKDDSTTIVTSEGKTKKMKDIAVGQTIEAKGTVSNGVFVGKLIVVITQQ